MFVLSKDVVRQDIEKGISRKILAHGGNMMLVEVTFEKGATGALHSHSHEQVSYIHKGSFEFEIEGEKKTVKEGDSIYIPKDAVHGVIALEDSVIIDVFTPQREDFL